MLEAADPILLVVPAQAIRWACGLLGDTERRLVICAKGIERDTGRRLSDVVAEVLPASGRRGPLGSILRARGRPGAAHRAGLRRPDPAGRSRALADLVASRSFRVYPTDDMAGVEIGGR